MNVILTLGLILYALFADRTMSLATSNATGSWSGDSVEGDPEAWLGSESLDRVRSLVREARFAAAETLARRELAKVEARFGTNSQAAAQVLDLLLEALWRAGRAHHRGTLELAQRAVGIREAYTGGKDPALTTSLRNLAIVFEDTGETVKAETVYQRIIDLRSSDLGSEDPETALAIVDLANFYLNAGTYFRALPLYRRALAIQEKMLGSTDIQFALTLNNLANALHRSGRLAEAKPLYERAIAVKEKALGSNHVDVAWSLNGLAILNEDLGYYSEARSLYERTLTIREKVLGPNHLLVAGVLNNLAQVYRLEGDYRTARTLTERALTMSEGTLGADHLTVARTRDNLAQLLFLTGDVERAKTVRKVVLELRRELLGQQHPDYAETLRSFADLVAASGGLEAARCAYEEALSIQRRALGPGHLALAETSISLGRLLLQVSELTQAELAVKRALEIRERTLGTTHPLVGEALKHLAVILAYQGRLADALEIGIRAEEIGRTHLRLTARTLSERRAFSYASVRSSSLDLLLSLVGEDQESRSVELVWDALVRSRALVLDEMAARNHVAGSSKDSEIARLFRELATRRQSLANLVFRPPAPDDSELYLRQVAEARRDKEEAEQVLAKKSAAFRHEQNRARIGLADIQRLLPPETALVAFVLYDRLAGAEDAWGSALPSSERAYIAFVLDPEKRAPAVVPLDLAENIDPLVARWRGQAAGGGLMEGAGGETAYRQIGEALRAKIWDPIASRLGMPRQVLLVPDGALHRVNFAAFPTSPGQYLVEEGPAVHYLSAERDVVQAAIGDSTGTGVLALGGPDFDGSAVGTVGTRHADMGRTPHSGRDRSSGNRRSACSEFLSLRFGPLPGSVSEVDEILSLWKPAVGSSETVRGRSQEPLLRLIGAQAHEGAAKELAPGRRVVHLATHGFFLGESCPSVLGPSRGIGGLSLSSQAIEFSAVGESPLLLAGLALAGANRRDTAAVDEEDGILTAEEVAGMDLTGVEWVVLSACNTGIGEVKAGEGVLGLRRAFQLAGARTVVMSLWPVDDQAAREWMKELYRGRLLEHLTTAQAVHQASLRTLTQRRKEGQSTHPFYWAAFVAAGDWR